MGVIKDKVIELIFNKVKREQIIKDISIVTGEDKIDRFIDKVKEIVRVERSKSIDEMKMEVVVAIAIVYVIRDYYKLVGGNSVRKTVNKVNDIVVSPIDAIISNIIGD